MDFDDDDLPAGFPDAWGRIVDHIRLNGVQRSKTSQPMRGARAYPEGEKPGRNWNSAAHRAAALRYSRKIAADAQRRSRSNARRRSRYAAKKAKER